jgi:hypothetical protein
MNVPALVGFSIALAGLVSGLALIRRGRKQAHHRRGVPPPPPPSKKEKIGKSESTQFRDIAKAFLAFKEKDEGQLGDKNLE